VDYFLRRDLHVHAELLPSGDALVDVTAEMRNSAEAGKGLLLVRPVLKTLTRGLNRMALYFSLPQGGLVGPMTVEDRKVNALRGEEVGRQVAWQFVSVPPGERLEVSLSFRWRRAWRPEGKQVFSLKLVPQATVWPDRFSVQIEPGARKTLAVHRMRDPLIKAARLTKELDDGSLRFEGTLQQPKVAAVRVVAET
jgi:hypothetical protein